MSSSFACSPLRMRRLLRDNPPASSRSSSGPSPTTASSWAASLAAAALPSSMVLAISTSSSAFSSGTRPISLRYVWTGSSALPLDSAETARRVAVGSRRDGAAPSERCAARAALRGAVNSEFSSSTSSSTSTTPSAVTRWMRVVSTSGVSSTACSASISSSCVSCPFSRPAASAASKSTCETPSGSATCATDASPPLTADPLVADPFVGAGTAVASRPSSSMATAESSLTLHLPNPSLLWIPLDQPRYQPVGGIAPGARFPEFVQPAPHLHRLGRRGLPRVGLRP